jgi:hypothetical protein
MKFSAVALIAVAAVASAQSIADIPACAQTCLLPALQATGCNLTDFKCSCSNKDFVSGSTACILKACSAADAEKAAAATYALCKSVGVTIPTQPVSGGTPATTSAAPPSSSAAPVSSSSAAPVSSSSSAAAVPSTYTSVVAPPTYGQTTVSTYAPVPTTIASTTSAAPNGTVPTPTPPIQTGNGASAVVAGNLVLALGGAVAAFFL